MEIPNLAGVVTKQDVETKGSGSYKADYVSWARTVQLLHQHAPGWMPEAVPADGGCLLHQATVGCYLMIRFVHVDGAVTPAFPQAVMSHRNEPVPLAKITSRDITDTHRRGVCMAAAMVFGLASELWAKNLGENPYRTDTPEPISGNGQSIPATQQEAKPSSNDSAPTVASLKAELDSIPEDDAEALRKAFMADYHPSWTKKMNASHLGDAKHRIAFKKLIDEYRTPLAA